MNHRPGVFWATTLLVLAGGVGLAWRLSLTYRAESLIALDAGSGAVEKVGDRSWSGTTIEATRDQVLCERNIARSLALAGLEPQDLSGVNTQVKTFKEAVEAVRRAARVRQSNKHHPQLCIQIEFRSRDPHLSATLARALARTYADQLATGEVGISTETARAPIDCTVEELPVTSKISDRRLATLSALALGVSVLAGFLVVRCFGVPDTSFKSVAEARDYLSIPVVGVVPVTSSSLAALPD